MFALILLYIPAFLIGLSIQDSDSRLLANSKTTFLVAFTFFIPAFFFTGFLSVLFLPVLAVTLSICVGWWSRLLWQNNKRWSGALLGFIFVFTPLIFLAVTIHKMNKEREARAAQTYAYQSLTVSEKFGKHNLTVPISPQLRLAYTCEFSMHPDFRTACLQREYSEDYRSLSVEGRLLTAPKLTGVKILAVEDDCREINSWMTSCVGSDVLREWCLRRKDMNGTFFCTNNLKTEIELKRKYESREQSYNNRYPQWVDAGHSAIGIDTQGKPVFVKCLQSRDLSNSRRAAQEPHEKSIGRHCRLKYLIADGVMVEATYNSDTPDQLIKIGKRVHQQAQKFWNDMVVEVEGT